MTPQTQELSRKPQCHKSLRREITVDGTVFHLIRSLHSYELPAIFAVPVEEASHSYRRWVIDNVRPVE
ncbi:MAG: divalent cation tolerance protein CutA [Planctomycetaceae bacterium]|nr:divalent cation tolerance protein CutA [Planctomycetaceae bacterium]